MVGSDSRASLRGIRALVVGASGCLGRAVTVALAARGAEVGAAVRDPERLPPSVRALLARTARADAERPGQLAAAIADWSPRVLFLLSGYGVAKSERDPAAMRRVNVDFAVEAARAMAARGSAEWSGMKLVHAGSALEYGPLSHAPDEAVTAAPDTSYGQSKLAATDAVRDVARAAAQPFVTARLFTVFGHGEREGRLFPTLLAARSATGPVALSAGTQQRDFAFAGDVAEALLDIACCAADDVLRTGAPLEHGIVNVASGRLHPVRQFVTSAARALGIDAERLRFGAVAQLAEETAHLPVPVDRLRRAIGRALPEDLDDVIARCVAELPGSVDG